MMVNLLNHAHGVSPFISIFGFFHQHCVVSAYRSVQVGFRVEYLFSWCCCKNGRTVDFSVLTLRLVMQILRGKYNKNST